MNTVNLSAPPLPTITDDIRTTALQILAWARDNGLLADDAFQPKNVTQHPLFEPMILDSGVVSVFRNRQIRFVAVNDLADKISIFFRKAAPTMRELKILPKSCNGYDIEYHQGNSELVAPANLAASTNSCAVHVHGGLDFYTCGSSISVGNNREAGTIGALVKDAAGQIFGLSNNHVSGACSYAPIGLPVVAPGIMDVSPWNPAPFTVGYHTHHLPMNFGDPSSVDHSLNSDAALFRIAAPGSISSMQRNLYDTPASVVDIQPGMQVEKLGRTTGHTIGYVTAELIGPSPVYYQAAQYGFNGNAFFENLFIVHGVGDVFSEGGDSGSLVTHLDANGQRHAIGIVVAGCTDSSAPGGKRSLVLPLRPILDRFNVTLVSQHNC
ncbi:hypothetical protein [Delftia deserti]|uniref:Uncharacterized protein n=1 Tax=Delftia deserti TaxID=1651218 RepID=A0ABW5EYM0_9BURK